MKYHLELNEEQVNIVVRALDLFSRVGMIQLEEVAHVLLWHGVAQDEQRDRLLSLCKEMKALFGYSANGHAGIANPKVPEAFKVAYDIECVLRQKIDQEGSVWKNDPLHVAKGVPLAKVECQP